MRIALGLEYQGSRYHGWQKQPSTSKTIQETLETALSEIAQAPISVICAGRTDAGVHASAQVVHFDTDAVRPEHAWIKGTNSLLPKDIRVTWAKAVSEEFHARFSATGRTYTYYIDNRRIHSPFMPTGVTWYPLALNAEKMQAGANHLIGKHDFSAYRASGCQAKNPVRDLITLTVERTGDMITLTVQANAFLHHMIRNIVGVLLAIGEEKAPPEWAKAVLDSKNRSEGANTGPAAGLYLSDITYPQAFQLPAFRGLPNMKTLSSA